MCRVTRLQGHMSHTAGTHQPLSSLHSSSGLSVTVTVVMEEARYQEITITEARRSGAVRSITHR